MKPISRIRFDALAGYARQPAAYYAADELGYYEHGNERVLGIVIRDHADADFAGLIFARDRRQRFRCVHVCNFDSRRRYAEVTLRREMERIAAEPDDTYYQGDDDSAPVDFFTAVVPAAKLNPNFVRLRDMEEYSPARGIIESMMRWYEDADGNFVEQFQTTGFDARIWELYLFAAFTEMGYLIDRSRAVPDFFCRHPENEFCVEAVTVNPTKDASGADIPEPPIETSEQVTAYLEDYMPIKFGSALRSKLLKRYWTDAEVAAVPLLFAIQDFSAPQSLIRTRSAFESYVYGYKHDWERDEEGNIKILPRKVNSHRWGTKEIPSGFFDQPETENISAILFSNSGTISKFNRMGLLAGFGSPRVRLVRVGTAVDLDPRAVEPVRFERLVNSPDYSETWCEGLDVWHNPKALRPIDKIFLPRIAHHQHLGDGRTSHAVPEGHPYGSMTLHTLKK